MKTGKKNGTAVEVRVKLSSKGVDPELEPRKLSLCDIIILGLRRLDGPSHHSSYLLPDTHKYPKANILYDAHLDFSKNHGCHELLFS